MTRRSHTRIDNSSQAHWADLFEKEVHYELKKITSSDQNRRGLILLSDSLAKLQIVTEETVHGREREDSAGMARCNVQLN